jgi:DNA-binding NarL/FixJ family response regulator
MFRRDAYRDCASAPAVEGLVVAVGGEPVNASHTATRHGKDQAHWREHPTVGPIMTKIKVAIQAPDPLSFAGICGPINRRPDMELIPDDRLAEADVYIVVVPSLSGVVMRQLRAFVGTEKVRIVMVLDQLGDADLLVAAEIGVVATIWRVDATPERIVESVLIVSRGGGDLPREIQAKLLADVAHVQRNVLAPRGLSASGLESREVDLLRLLAEGLDTAEVAQRMRYSERTVKGILYGLMTRLNLRNRSHAVAYAMRAGLL